MGRKLEVVIQVKFAQRRLALAQRALEEFENDFTNIICTDESIWKMKVYNGKKFNNIDELKQPIRDATAEMPQSLLLKVVESMPARLQRVTACRGQQLVK